MSKWGWIAGGWEEVSFKRASDGWLFSLPFLWSRRTYLVTDEQKALLSKPLRRTMWGTFLSVMVLIFVMAVVGPFAQSDRSSGYWLLYIILGIIIMLLAWIYLTIAMRPLPSRLEPTQERVTYADRFTRHATILPTALIIIGTMFSFALFAIGIGLGLKGKWDAGTIFGSVFFGLLTVYWMAVFAAKQKIKRSTTTNLG